MQNMKLLCLIMLTAFSLPISFCQDAPEDPVFTVSFDQEFALPGDTVEVVLKADIPMGLHMYSTYNQCDIGPFKLDFHFRSHTSYVLVGLPYSVGDQRITDDIFKCELGRFDRQAEIRQKIKILDGQVSITGAVEGQWCTDHICYNFGMASPVSFSGILKAKPETPQPVKSSDPKSGPKKTDQLNSDSIFLKPND
jgi:hypothetical protein